MEHTKGQSSQKSPLSFNNARFEGDDQRIGRIPDEEMILQYINENLSLDDHLIVEAFEASGEVLFLNRRFFSVYGLSPLDTKGKCWDQLSSEVYPDEKWIEMREEVKRKGIWRGMTRPRTKEGRRILVSSTISLFKWSENSREIYVHVSSVPPRRIESVQESSTSARPTRSMVDKVSSIQITTTTDGTICLVEPPSRTVFEYKIEEILGQSLTAVLFNGDELRERATLIEKETGVAVHSEFEVLCRFDQITEHIQESSWTVRRKCGSLVTVPLSVVQNCSRSGEVEGFCFVIYDSNSVARDESNVGSRGGSSGLNGLQMVPVSVVASFLHDFNNLLTTVQGSVSQLEDELGPERNLIGPVLNIQAASVIGAELCSELSRYAREGGFGADRLCLNQTIFQLLRVLKAMVGKKCNVEFSRSSDLPRIFGNVSQIRQVILNLVINAAEAMEGRQGSVMISTGTVSLSRAYISECNLGSNRNDGLYVFVEVKDTGCGIDPKTLERLFCDQMSTKSCSRGLGLCTVGEIVDQHKGLVRVYSETGEGTVFRIMFPLKRSGSRLSPPVVPIRGLDLSGKCTVVVFDQDAIVGSVIARMVSSLGCDSTEVSNEADAFELLRSERYSKAVVVFDLRDPVTASVAGLRRLLMHFPGTPVVVSSGFDLHSVCAKLEGLLISGFLVKPFSRSSLAHELSKAIDRFRSNSFS